MIRRYRALGSGVRQALAFAVLGLVAAPDQENRTRTRHLLSKLSPRLWLAPRALRGLKLLIDPFDWSQTVIFDEIFLGQSYDLSRLAFTPDQVLDCGAHIGMFSLLAAAAFPSSRMTAFEPNPRNAGFIRRVIRKNGLPLHLEEAAVSDREGKQRFESGNSHSGHLTAGGSQNNTYDVTTVDFVRFVRENCTERLLLKMDIEGGEVIVLPKVIPHLPATCALFFETHAGPSGFLALQQLLRTEGFEVEQLNERGLYIDAFAQRR